MTVDYDTVIRGGKIVDGSGGKPYVGDVAIRSGRIVAVGDITAGANETTIDATGRLVTPGFVDIHTHYDGHVTWGQRLGPSSQHGVTTIVTGNCGVGFAPCRPKDRETLLHLMEGVEDIPEVVMAAGLPWNWETFPEYLDSLQDRHFDMDIATQVPHAPLRVYVMGDRAAERDPATPEDIALMRELTQNAVQAGALGFSTSRSLNHKSSNGSVTPSYAAASDELAGIASGLGESGLGVLQFISDFDDMDAEFDIVRRMVKESGRPLSLSVIQMHHVPQRWRELLDRIGQANADGLTVKGQVSGRPIGLMAGFRMGRNPFAAAKAFQEIAYLRGDARIAALSDPERRARILEEFPNSGAKGQASALMTNFHNLYEYGGDGGYEPKPEESIAARAERAGVEAAQWCYDLLLEDDGQKVLYMPGANFAGNSIAAIEQMLASEYTILGLGDGGAHCGLICDASLPTYMLQRWSNLGAGTMPVEQIIKALSNDTASTVGLLDRGRIAVGYKADINIIDPDHIALHQPEMVYDLPDNAGRLGQPADGYDLTMVSGAITYRKGVPTGQLPGRLVRGAQNPIAA